MFFALALALNTPALTLAVALNSALALASDSALALNVQTLTLLIESADKVGEHGRRYWSYDTTRIDKQRSNRSHRAPGNYRNKFNLPQ